MDSIGIPATVSGSGAPLAGVGRSGFPAWPGRVCYRVLLTTHWMIVRAFTLRRRALVPHATTILLTGTFYSENWILNHLRPLAGSEHCAEVLLVTTLQVGGVDKITTIFPPWWLVRTVGAVPARLIWFVVIALSRRPDVVGGFHLLPNGLLAVVIARLIGSRSVYFCGGGPREVEGGGYQSGSRSWRLLKAPDANLERKLIRAIDCMDLVITMGKSAERFLRQRGVRTRIEVMPGGVDPLRFRPVNECKSYDLILVGRLHPVKRIDVFLRVVALLAGERADISAVVVGEGELEERLKALASSLGIQRNVTFAGHQPDVASWLGKSKVFVLTSESEGLSLALMEAMMAGLPCVVTDVGELGELVEHGRTGYLISDSSPESFCEALRQLLDSAATRERFGEASRRSAQRVTTEAAVDTWNAVLGTM